MQPILLADDDPDVLEGLRTLLTAWGYEVETARDGRAALDRIGALHPSAVAGGALGYLAKPVDTARLKSLLASAVR
jgi:PleD family two-component response regulator